MVVESGMIGMSWGDRWRRAVHGLVAVGAAEASAEVALRILLLVPQGRGGDLRATAVSSGVVARILGGVPIRGASRRTGCFGLVLLGTTEDFLGVFFQVVLRTAVLRIAFDRETELVSWVRSLLQAVPGLGVWEPVRTGVVAGELPWWSHRGFFSPRFSAPPTSGFGLVSCVSGLRHGHRSSVVLPRVVVVVEEMVVRVALRLRILRCRCFR